MITTSSNFTAVNYFIPILIIAKTQKATIKITSQAENRTLILRLGTALQTSLISSTKRARKLFNHKDRGFLFFPA
jgi:hypothetical protein